MTQTESTARPKGQPKKLMLIRFGRMGTLGWFEHNETQVPHTKTHAIIKTSRGLELGRVVGQGNYRSGQFRSTPEQVADYFGPTEMGQPVITEMGSFVRFATHEDLREQQHLELSAVAEAKTCEKFTREMNLPMKIVDAEHLFGGERVVIYFTSEGRVDFRELVKRLAKEYQTRIELRQIGSRDEARLIGDYETCGQECCCKRYLKILAPVNMRMAKLQKATLDPSKISGHCGRLKCCLRYEDDTYQELREKLPKKNVVVSTPQGPGRVVDVQILTQLVVVQSESGERQAWPLEEIRVLDNSSAPASESGEAGTAKSPPVTEREIEELEQAESEVENTSRQDTSQREDFAPEPETAEADSKPDESSDARDGQDVPRSNERSNEQGQQQNRDNSNRGGQRKKKFRRRFNNRNDRSNPNTGGPKPNPPQTPGA